MSKFRIGAIADLHAGDAADGTGGVASQDGNFTRIISNWSQRLTEFAAACAKYNVDAAAILGDTVDENDSAWTTTFGTVCTQLKAELETAAGIPAFVIMGNHARLAGVTVRQWCDVWDPTCTLAVSRISASELWPKPSRVLQDYSAYHTTTWNTDFQILGLMCRAGASGLMSGWYEGEEINSGFWNHSEPKVITDVADGNPTVATCTAATGYTVGKMVYFDTVVPDPGDMNTDLNDKSFTITAVDDGVAKSVSVDVDTTGNVHANGGNANQVITEAWWVEDKMDSTKFVICLAHEHLGDSTGAAPMLATARAAAQGALETHSTPSKVVVLQGHYHKVDTNYSDWDLITTNSVRYYSFRGSTLGNGTNDMKGNTFYIIEFDNDTGVVDITTLKHESSPRLRYSPYNIDTVMGRSASRGRYR